MASNHVKLQKCPPGYQLLTDEQREEMDTLNEAKEHPDTMKFSGVDALTLKEYEALCERLEVEWLHSCD